MVGIYKITNLINNKIYIGQSVNIDRRFREHCQRTEQQIDQAIHKYGVDNFSFEIIETCEPQDLNMREWYWIQYYKSTIPNGYNISWGQGCHGEDNSQAKLTTKDIEYIRTIYNDKKYVSMMQVWTESFADKISYGDFTAIVRGDLWSHVMPEVFTQENYDYYIAKNRGWMFHQNGEDNHAAVLTTETVMDIRQMYVNHNRQEIFNKYPNINQRTITSIISGQNWKHLPIYKKREKIWVYPEREDNNESK